MDKKEIISFSAFSEQKILFSNFTFALLGARRVTFIAGYSIALVFHKIIYIRKIRYLKLWYINDIESNLAGNVLFNRLIVLICFEEPLDIVQGL